MLPAEFDVFPLLFTLPHRARAMRQSVKSFLTKVFWLGIPSIRAWHSIGSTQQIQAQTHTYIFIYRGRGSLFDERQHQIERCSQPSKGKQDWPRRLNPGQVVQRRYPPPLFMMRNRRYNKRAIFLSCKVTTSWPGCCCWSTLATSCHKNNDSRGFDAAGRCPAHAIGCCLGDRCRCALIVCSAQ